MTGPQHYQAAESLIELAGEDAADPDAPYAHEMYLLAKAQVHATLALAAATSATIDPDGSENIVSAWYEAGAW